VGLISAASGNDGDTHLHHLYSECHAFTSLEAGGYTTLSIEDIEEDRDEKML
jgi:hypothetical protein